MTRRIGWLSFVAFTILAATFFLKTTGIHLDASNYLFIAYRDPFGDSGTTGKPWLFYGLNYALINSVGLLAGRFRAMSLDLIYMAAFAISLAWAVTRVQAADSRLDALLRISLVVASALALVSGTVLMMESAALPALTVALGCAATGASTRRSQVALLVSSAVATAIKATTVPGLLLLALAFVLQLRGRTLLIVAGVAAGLVVNAIGLRWIGPQSTIAYGGIGDLWSSRLIAERLSRTGPHVILWLAFVGVNLAVVVLASPRRVLQDRALQVLVPGSLAAVFVVQLVSSYDFARYCYPVMWVALLWVLLTADVARRGLVVSLLVVELAMAAPLFMRSPQRFRFWPELVTREMINSSGTLFPGIPVYGLAARQLLRDSKPCVWINSENGERNELIKQFVRPMFPTSRIHVSPAFDPDHDPACTAARTIRIWREHAENPEVGCTASCGSCSFQKMEYFFLKPGWVRNQVCWTPTGARRP